MVSISHDPPELEKPLQIRQDTKFYNKLLSKETSLANPSFRVYYGVASGAVPFIWESQPGTPKHTFHSPSLPPLTPPPSYQLNLESKKGNKKHTRFISSMIAKLALKKSHTTPSSPASVWSTSVSSSSSFSPTACHRRTRFSSSVSSFSSGADEEEFEQGSPTSTLCFGVRHSSTGRLRGCYSVLLSIVGHGSRQGTAA